MAAVDAVTGKFITPSPIVRVKPAPGVGSPGLPPIGPKRVPDVIPDNITAMKWDSLKKLGAQHRVFRRGMNRQRSSIPIRSPRTYGRVYFMLSRLRGAAASGR